MEDSASDFEQHIPSFIKNSCPGTSAEVVTEEDCFFKNSQGTVTFRPVDDLQFGGTPGQGEASDEIVEKARIEKAGWTKSLTSLPCLTNEKIDDRLLKNSIFSQSRSAPKAFRNKRQGYKLWKGYVRAVFVKPDIKAKQVLFLAKSKVCASMKNIQYNVYIHLDQATGDVVFAKCSCKAGQGGCCKHVAALLYTVLDYVNMGAVEVPPDLTCTQVGQKWNVPSRANAIPSKAFKFEDLVFEKIEESKKRKRPLVTGSRDPYCATPQFALQTSADELKGLVERLRLTGKASLLCEAIESNEFQPCSMFKTSSCKAVDCIVASSLNQQKGDDPCWYIHALYEHVPSDRQNSELVDSDTLQNIFEKLGVSIERSTEVCLQTMSQSTEPIWYLECSKRITASYFGKVLNRRQSIHPTSLIKSITEKRMKGGKSMPTSLRWGVEHEEIAIRKYMESRKHISAKKFGFVISPAWPWLGCSPDGIIFQDDIPVGCLEVKCPYSKKDMTLQEASLNDKSFFLKCTDNGLQLKYRNSYYYQCQGLLNLLGLPWIDFAVYTLKDFYVERIYRDESLWKSHMLPSLTGFFVKYIFPQL